MEVRGRGEGVKCLYISRTTCRLIVFHALYQLKQCKSCNEDFGLHDETVDKLQTQRVRGEEQQSDKLLSDR